MAVTLHTSCGDVKLELYVKEAPKACTNFLALAASGKYDNCLFHRNIPGFMIQTGDPTGTGKGGDSIWGGPFADEFHPSLRHNRRGIVSMANKGPNTNKSQFFITYAEASHLDDVYTVFGHVIHGLEALDEMENVPVGEKDRPLEKIVLKNITIHANPIADEHPTLSG